MVKKHSNRYFQVLLVNSNLKYKLKICIVFVLYDLIKSKKIARNAQEEILKIKNKLEFV